MTRMADDFERADHERDLRKHEPRPGDQKAFSQLGDDRAENDLLLVALIVCGLLGSVLIALWVLLNHAAHL